MQALSLQSNRRPLAQASLTKRRSMSESLAPLIIGVYGADLHKLAINTASVLFASPLAWKDVAATLDVVLAVATVSVSVLAFLSSSRFPRVAVVPLLSQVLLVALMSAALWMHFDDISLLNYKRFIGGNIALFFGAIFVCNRTWKIRLVWSIWLATALLQSFIAIWYWREGYLWTSIRSTLIPATGIRMGYQCAIAFVYCLFASGDKNWKSIGMCCLFAFGVLMSGSKMALLLTVFASCGMFAFEMIKTQKVAALRLILFSISSVAILQFLFLIASSEKEGFHKYVLDFDHYVSSVQNREDLSEEFFELAWEHPVTGSGISAGYYELNGDQMQTTHSAVQATFLQLGMLGLSTYLLLVLYLALIGFRRIWKTRRASDSRFYMAIATYAAFVMLMLKAEVTSDLPGNRELWLFSGILVHCLERLEWSAGHSRKESEPCVELQAA